jgi:glycosyltransferase involved in cell wall biosynthesis
MAVFNERPALLQKAIDSITRQSCERFEFIIVDDGSTSPDTREVLVSSAARDPRIHVEFAPHRGHAASLNHGLSLCRATLVCRQDSDDWSEPDRLAAQISFMDATANAGLVGTHAMLHQEDETPLWVPDLPTSHGEIALALHDSNPFFHGSVCFRRDPVRALGGYREWFYTAEDYDLFWRISDAYGARNLPRVLYHHRRTGHAISTTMAERRHKERALIQALAQMRAELGFDDLEQAKWRISSPEMVDAREAVSAHAEHLLLAGRYQAAFGAFRGLILQSPFSAVQYLRLVRAALFVVAPLLRRHMFRQAPLARNNTSNLTTLRGPDRNGTGSLRGMHRLGRSAAPESAVSK